MKTESELDGRHAVGSQSGKGLERRGGLEAECMKTMHELERIDSLIIDDMKVVQRSDQFCFSIDSIALAHFPKKLSAKKRYVDLGTGTAVIPLLMTSRGASHIWAYEFNPIMVDLARRNVEINGRGNKIRIVDGDYCTVKDQDLQGYFDGATINPPYYAAGSGYVSQADGEKLARHEQGASLQDIVRAATRLVRYGGYIWMVHRAERLPDCTVAFRDNGAELKRLRPVYSRLGGQCKIILMEAVVGGKPGMALDSPLYIYNSDGSYSREVAQWYER